jgi:hypothetical protein
MIESKTVNVCDVESVINSLLKAGCRLEHDEKPSLRLLISAPTDESCLSRTAVFK